MPRSRFLPVKHCSDLLLLRSDLYTLEHGRLLLSPERQFATAPVVALSEQFSKIDNFQSRFRGIPKMMDLDDLTVSGNVHFGRNVTLKGTVIGALLLPNFHMNDQVLTASQSLLKRANISTFRMDAFSRIVSV